LLKKGVSGKDLDDFYIFIFSFILHIVENEDIAMGGFVAFTKAVISLNLLTSSSPSVTLPSSTSQSSTSSTSSLPSVSSISSSLSSSSPSLLSSPSSLSSSSSSLSVASSSSLSPSSSSSSSSSSSTTLASASMSLSLSISSSSTSSISSLSTLSTTTTTAAAVASSSSSSSTSSVSSSSTGGWIAPNIHLQILRANFEKLSSQIKIELQKNIRNIPTPLSSTAFPEEIIDEDITPGVSVKSPRREKRKRITPEKRSKKKDIRTINKNTNDDEAVVQATDDITTKKKIEDNNVVKLKLSGEILDFFKALNSVESLRDLIPLQISHIFKKLAMMEKLSDCDMIELNQTCPLIYRFIDSQFFKVNFHLYGLMFYFMEIQLSNYARRLSISFYFSIYISISLYRSIYTSFFSQYVCTYVFFT
jgi:hypothetical protein